MKAQGSGKFRHRLISTGGLFQERPQVVMQFRSLRVEARGGLHFFNCGSENATKAQDPRESPIVLGVSWSKADCLTGLCLGFCKIMLLRQSVREIQVSLREVWLEFQGKTKLRNRSFSL